VRTQLHAGCVTCSARLIQFFSLEVLFRAVPFHAAVLPSVYQVPALLWPGLVLAERESRELFVRALFVLFQAASVRVVVKLEVQSEPVLFDLSFSPAPPSPFAQPGQLLLFAAALFRPVPRQSFFLQLPC